MFPIHIILCRCLSYFRNLKSFNHAESPYVNICYYDKKKKKKLITNTNMKGGLPCLWWKPPHAMHANSAQAPCLLRDSRLNKVNKWIFETTLWPSSNENPIAFAKSHPSESTSVVGTSTTRTPWELVNKAPIARTKYTWGVICQMMYKNCHLFLWSYVCVIHRCKGAFKEFTETVMHSRVE